MTRIKAYVYSSLWGMPSGGPFSLKLLSWLRMTGRDYEIVVENDVRKGPKKKNPWIEIDGELMGDTELIIQRLDPDRTVDASLSSTERAIALAFARLLDEHLHQVVTHTHFVSDIGWSVKGPAILGAIDAPGPMNGFIGRMMRRSIRQTNWARGMSRHDDPTIQQMGIDDLRALSAYLGDKPYLMGSKATTVDASMYGLLSFILQVPIPHPLREQALASTNLVAYHTRFTEAFWAEHADAIFAARSAAA